MTTMSDKRRGHMLRQKAAVSKSSKCVHRAAALHEVARARDEAARKVEAHNAHIKDCFKNQDRLRENIKSLEKVSTSKAAVVKLTGKVIGSC